jgi:hypothetical protein
MDELLDSELDEIDGRARSATQGPWFVRFLDDDFASSLVAVSTSPDTRKGRAVAGFRSHRDGRRDLDPGSP